MWAVRTIVQAIALATTGALLGLGVNALRPAGVSLLRPWVGDNDATAECALASADPVRIDAVAAMRLLATHAAVFGDVRVLSGGFRAWRDGGGSAASGPCEVGN